MDFDKLGDHVFEESRKHANDVEGHLDDALSESLSKSEMRLQKNSAYTFLLSVYCKTHCFIPIAAIPLSSDTDLQYTLDQIFLTCPYCLEEKKER